MRAGVKTTGELRSLLLETIEGVRSGSTDTNKASAIAKLAGQITASLTAEAQMALVQHRLGIEPGNAPLDAPIEVTALPSQETKEKPEIDFGSTGRRWCDQCDMSVAEEVARNCKSPFCKVRP